MRRHPQPARPRAASHVASRRAVRRGTCEPVRPAHAAEPQRAELLWHESYPSTGMRLRFGVERLAVRRDGWSVEIEVTNSTRTPFELGRPAELEFGLMLFETGELDELTEAVEHGGPPTAATGEIDRASASARPPARLNVAGDALGARLARRRQLGPRLVRPVRRRRHAAGGDAAPRRLDHRQGLPAVTARDPRSL